MESKITSITTQVSAPLEIVECFNLLDQIRTKVENHYQNAEDSLKPSLKEECDTINENLSAIALDLSEIIKEHIGLDLYFERNKAKNQQ